MISFCCMQKELTRFSKHPYIHIAFLVQRFVRNLTNSMKINVLFKTVYLMQFLCLKELYDGFLAIFEPPKLVCVVGNLIIIAIFIKIAILEH